jgi:hypothetical protein
MGYFLKMGSLFFSGKVDPISFSISTMSRKSLYESGLIIYLFYSRLVHVIWICMDFNKKTRLFLGWYYSFNCLQMLPDREQKFPFEKKVPAYCK